MQGTPRKREVRAGGVLRMCQVGRRQGENMRPKGKSKTCQRRKPSVSHKGGVAPLRLSRRPRQQSHPHSLCPRGPPAREAEQRARWRAGVPPAVLGLGTRQPKAALLA